MTFSGLVGGEIHLQIGANGRILSVWTERFLDNRVQDAVALDGRRTDVGQQRKGDAVPFGEVGENRLRVVADSRDVDPLAAKLLKASLQLDELRAAERSPIGGAEEHQHRSARTNHRLQRLGAAVLIPETEIGNPLTDLRSELGDVDLLAHSR